MTDHATRYRSRYELADEHNLGIELSAIPKPQHHAERISRHSAMAAAHRAMAAWHTSHELELRGPAPDCAQVYEDDLRERPPA